MRTVYDRDDEGCGRL